ncbi:MAG TPA: hypothetical protein VM534_00605 [Thermoanaerobaculia bacterium]|nr:hypothetical protein [Thermoanaerobaculia bacterium]
MIFALALLLATAPPSAAKLDHSTCPIHRQHAAANEHGKAVDARHDTFGMSHETTRHSFRLLRSGGAIELRNLTTDVETTKAIRSHLRQVTEDFSRGDFSKPLFVHGEVPPAVDRMKELAGAIRYRYEKLPDGGRIRILTATPAAASAVHDFLRFQIEDHRTGDPGRVE